MKTKIILTTLGFILSSIIILSCSKPKGSITFWISFDNGCGPVSVAIDGNNSGTITNWQTIAPSACTGSNTLLNVQTTQGKHDVRFKNGCKEWVQELNLTSDCFIYKVL
jgi:hypothetical protein